MLTTPAYIPRPGALPEKVLAYFAANPEECLTAEDIAEKFGAIRSNVHTQLRAALDAGCLKQGQQERPGQISRGTGARGRAGLAGGIAKS